MFTVPPAGAEPKRKRGHLRVAAIMQAGVEVFTEKGFDAATMTEIATRSKTATASLYRFFPSKEALADALLMQYAQYALGGLTELRDRAAGMTTEAIADALVDLRVEILSGRRFAIDLADARDGGGDRQKRFRMAMLEHVASILKEAIPGLTKARTETMAAVLVHVLKGVPDPVEQKHAAGRRLLAEIKELVRVYLASARTPEKPGHADERPR